MIVGSKGPGYLGSPGLENLNRLREQGTGVVYHDPIVPHQSREGGSSTDLDSALADAELAVIVTAHPGIDHAAIAEAIPTVDLRGVTRTKRATRVVGIAVGKES